MEPRPSESADYDVGYVTGWNAGRKSLQADLDAAWADRDARVRLEVAAALRKAFDGVRTDFDLMGEEYDKLVTLERSLIPAADQSLLAEHDAAQRRETVKTINKLLSLKADADLTDWKMAKGALDAYVQEKVAEARRDEIQAFEDAFMRTEVYDFCQKRRKLLPPSPSGDRGGAPSDGGDKSEGAR